MRVAFLGLGLIGGSIARSVRAPGAVGAVHAVGAVDAAGGTGDAAVARGSWSMVAWTPSGRGSAAAVDAGVIERAAPTVVDAVRGADLIVLAAPAPDCLSLLETLAGPAADAVARDAVITDVASTKAAIVDRADALGLRFVGGHPMAGRDTNGFGAAEAGLFADRPWVVVPSTDEAANARVEAFARATGARPVRMGAVDHDEAVAAVSHLPLLVAAALVEAVAGGSDGPRADWPAVAGLAASGWRDTTRLARGDVVMGTGIMTTNAAAIGRRLRDLSLVLDAWAAELERPGGPDAERVADRLRIARERLESMS